MNIKLVMVKLILHVLTPSSREPLKTAKRGISDPMMSLGNKSTSHEPISLKEVQKKPAASMIKDIKECTFQHGSQLSEVMAKMWSASSFFSLGFPQGFLM